MGWGRGKPNDRAGRSGKGFVRNQHLTPAMGGLVALVAMFPSKFSSQAAFSSSCPALSPFFLIFLTRVSMDSSEEGRKEYIRDVACPGWERPWTWSQCCLRVAGRSY